MLAKRIIPTILVRGQTAFKGPGFGAQCTRSVGSALAIARTHARRGVDELLILDIGATPEGRSPDFELVTALADGCFIPITVGGGVKSLDDIDALLRAGADKVAIGAEARRLHSTLIRDAADRFGAQAIVQIVELRTLGHSKYDLHAGELVIQAVDAEGLMGGYPQIEHTLGDFDQRLFKGPVIFSGGCSGPADMLAAIRAGADGVAAGALFQFTDTTPRDCARYLKANGVEVRL
jgi:cyclase